MEKTGSEINATFVPKELLIRTDLKAVNNIAQKKPFDKKVGNNYIELEPSQVRFAGYELMKMNSVVVKLINKAPIPQRVHILPPKSDSFSVKVNKKGMIPPGMAQTIVISFQTLEYVTLTDQIRINTESDNFVLPISAHPTLPNLQGIFPKLIDFGAVDFKQTVSNSYPIANPTPREFPFTFEYIKECAEIQITPLQGSVPPRQTINIEISFTPAAKYTSVAQVILRVKEQFGTEQIAIKIMGNGQEKQLPTSKRIKSSRLTPLAKTIKPEESIEGKQVGSSLRIKNQLGLAATMNPALAMKKQSFVISNAPRMLAKTMSMDINIKTLNPKQMSERQYLNRYQRIQSELKEKQIKFSQYLGEIAMNEEQIQEEIAQTEQFAQTRLRAILTACMSRFSTELSNSTAVEQSKQIRREITWDDKRNDQLVARKLALQRFMKAGSRVIVKYRLSKRLGKIHEFLRGCLTKEDVRKKVEESQLQAQQSKIRKINSNDFDFTENSLKPSYFQLQFKDSTMGPTQVYKPAGKTSFDDFKQLPLMQMWGFEMLNWRQVPLAPDFINQTIILPMSRRSAEEEYATRSAAVPAYQPIEMSLTCGLPIKVQTHRFIFDDQKLRRYRNYDPIDQKNISYQLSLQGKPVQDQFEGWTQGQHQVLKARFMRNTGCQYTLYNSHNFSAASHDIGFLGRLGTLFPETIDNILPQDILEDGDSDDEKLPTHQIEPSTKLIQKIESSNVDLRERREKQQIRNPEREMRKTIESSIQNLKTAVTGECIKRIKDINKFALSVDNRLYF